MTNWSFCCRGKIVKQILGSNWWSLLEFTYAYFARDKISDFYPISEHEGTKIVTSHQKRWRYWAKMRQRQKYQEVSLWYEASWNGLGTSRNFTQNLTQMCIFFMEDVKFSSDFHESPQSLRNWKRSTDHILASHCTRGDTKAPRERFLIIVTGCHWVGGASIKASCVQVSFTSWPWKW